jgi:N-acetylmuramoyl-L-alanine amidase
LKKIALDPGHFGGSLSVFENRHFNLDGFAPVKEGDLNLIIAHKLEKLLKESGFEVFLSRGSFDGFSGAGTFSQGEFDEFQKKDYEERAQRINEFDPDLLLAIHLNSNCYSYNMFMTDFDGVMTFIKDRGSLKAAKIMAAHLSKEFGLEFCQKNWFPEDVRDLWEDIGDGVNIRDLAILRNVNAVGVLTEGPMMNNKGVYMSLIKEERLLDIYAKALHGGVLELFE